jgi:CspA family cold shock protein
MDISPAATAPLPVPLPHAIGACKWFNNEKGLGFITQAEDVNGKTPFGWDVVVTRPAFQFDASKGLEDGALVAFDITQGPKGPQASNVHRITADQIAAIRDAWHAAAAVQPAH